MKRRLQVLGPGCVKCRMLADHAERAARELGLDFELEKITDFDEMLRFGLVATPALVVDGAVKVVGHVPSTPRLRELLAASPGEGVRP